MNEKIRQSYRRSGYDYSSEGFYFVTIVIKERLCLLDDIECKNELRNDPNVIFIPTPIGEIVTQEWLNMPNVRDNVKLHNYIIMPNHQHGIIEITHCKVNNIPNKGFKSPNQTLGSIIRGFKIAVIKQLKERLLGEQFPKLLEWEYKIWQRNYHDHIIRDATAYEKISDYIKDNPRRWVEKMV